MLFYIPSKKLNLIKNSSWQYFGTSKRTKGVKKNSPTAILDSTSKGQWICHVSDYNMSPFIASPPFQRKVTCDQKFFFFSRDRHRGIIGRGNDLRLRGRQWDGQSVGRSWRRGAGQGGGMISSPFSQDRLVSSCTLNYFQSSSFTNVLTFKCQLKLQYCTGPGQAWPGWREKETRIEV